MIYLTGDLHGGLDVKKVFDWYQKNNITEDDFLIQLGDFGYVWENPNSLRYCRERLKLCNWAKKKFTLLVVPGNHENYKEIYRLPIKEKFGGKARVLKPINPYSKKEYKEIYFLERGEIYTINDKTFLAMGGAESIDKNHRIKDITWWEEELWSKSEEDNCLKNLDKHNWNIDYVISHTCPTTVVREMIGYDERKSLDPTSRFFQYLLENGLKFKEWHFGHLHMEKQFQNFFCHYKDIPKHIEEF